MLGDSIRRRRGRERETAPRRPDHDRPVGAIPWGRLTLIGLAVTAVLFLAGYLFATQVLYPPVKAGGGSVPVPDVTGIPYLEARAAVDAAGLTAGERTELPHPDVAAGTVLAQAPLPGQRLQPGAAVRFAVSSGPPKLRVPDLVGFPSGTARHVLERVGVEVVVEERADDAPAGRVLAMDPGPGSERPLPSRITLYVSAGAPPADSLAVPDTIGTAVPPPVIPPEG